MSEKVNKFVASRLSGQVVPSDLGAILTAIGDDPDFEESDENPLKIVWAEPLWTNREYPLLDHNYLNDQDRADPDIMANVKAMQDTEKKLKFVVQCADQSLIGYWQPDQKTPLEKCALFWLDTEGQYELTEGKTLSETLAYRALIDGDQDEYRSLIEAFSRLGIPVPETDESAVFDAMDTRSAEIKQTPQRFRNQRYEHYRSMHKS